MSRSESTGAFIIYSPLLVVSIRLVDHIEELVSLSNSKF
jgi:hypothetical protein